MRSCGPCNFQGPHILARFSFRPMVPRLHRLQCEKQLLRRAAVQHIVPSEKSIADRTQPDVIQPVTNPNLPTTIVVPKLPWARRSAGFEFEAR